MQHRPLAVCLLALVDPVLRTFAAPVAAACLLYVAASTGVTGSAFAQDEQASPAASGAAPVQAPATMPQAPQGSSPTGSPPSPAAQPAPPAATVPAQPAMIDKPHVALILSLKSAGLGRLAEAVRMGVATAAGADRSDALPLITYPTGDDAKELVETFDRAIRQGARLVIGPLAKPAVHAIARSNVVTVPTLALTIPDTDVLLPDNMYAFGVQLESEARQIARLAQSQGRRRAVIIGLDTPLSKRVAQTFAEEWTRTGRLIVDQFLFTNDQVQLRKIRDGITLGNADMIFFALDAQRARQVRPYLGKVLPTYSTSQSYAPTNDVVGQHDLNGLVFVDMPWILMPDHPAVITYPRPQGVFSATDQDRFYALGIDAWRLGQSLLESGFNDAGTLDGVTGYITPGSGRQFRREAVAAQFVQGQPRLINPDSGR
jgi:outer membrane PBP1 activator LpoA protein